MQSHPISPLDVNPSRKLQQGGVKKHWMKCLKEALRQAEEEAYTKNCHEPAVLGHVEYFNKEDIAQLGTGRVWVRNSLIYYQARESDMHYQSVQFICQASQSFFSETQIPEGLRLAAWCSKPTDGAPDIYGCTAIKKRFPDGRLDIIGARSATKATVLIIEVTFRNGGFRKALTAGASYLMPWTNFVFVLLIILHEYPGRMNIESIEIVLLERTTPVQMITDAAGPTTGDCLGEPEITKSSTTVDLERHLSVRVLKRMRVTRTDVRDPLLDFVFELPIEDYVRLSGNPLEGGPMRTDLRQCCDEIFGLADDSVEAGIYPDQPPLL